MDAPLPLAQVAALRDAAAAPIPAHSPHNPSSLAALRRRGLLATRKGRLHWITDAGRARLAASLETYRSALS